METAWRGHEILRSSINTITAMAGMQPVPWENKAVSPEIRENVLRPIQATPHEWITALCNLYFTE